MKQSIANIINLPNEILLMIIDQLHGTALVNFAKTCKHINNLSQPHLELANTHKCIKCSSLSKLWQTMDVYFVVSNRLLFESLNMFDFGSLRHHDLEMEYNHFLQPFPNPPPRRRDDEIQLITFERMMYKRLQSEAKKLSENDIFDKNEKNKIEKNKMLSDKLEKKQRRRVYSEKAKCYKNFSKRHKPFNKGYGRR